MMRLAYPSFSIVILLIPAWILFLDGLKNAKKPFIYGFIFNSLFSTMLCSWVIHPMTDYYNYSIISSLLFQIFVIGAIPSLSIGLFSKIIHQRINNLNFYESSIIKGFNIVLFIGVTFVICEWLKIISPLGHSLGHIATVFYVIPEFLAITRFTGGSGLSFMIISSSAMLWLSYLMFENGKYFKSIIYGIIPIVLIIGIYLYGIIIIKKHQSRKITQKIDIAIIHAGIDQSSRQRDLSYKKNIIIYRNLSLNTFEDYGIESQRVIIWPETALSINIATNSEVLKLIKHIGEKTGAWMIIGSPSYCEDGENRKFYNSAFLFSPDGSIIDQYDKIYLLPFFEKRIPIFNIFTELNKKPYSPGVTSNIFRIKNINSNGKYINIGIFICYEVGISSLIHGLVQKGAELLVNISNDSWFDESSESLQQLSILSLRCAEYGLPGVRVSGYGIAAFVDPFGRVLKASNIKSRMVLKACQRIHENKPTLYSCFKDWFVLICGLLFIGFILKQKII